MCSMLEPRRESQGRPWRIIRAQPYEGAPHIAIEVRNAGEVVGWSMRETRHVLIALEALDMAIGRQTYPLDIRRSSTREVSSRNNQPIVSLRFSLTFKMLKPRRAT